MKIGAYVPTTIPTINATERPLITSPPNTAIAIIVMRVVSIVVESDLQAISDKV